MKESYAPNTTIYHYRFLSGLGANGMGEVYLAEDTRLNRKVAILELESDLPCRRECSSFKIRRSVHIA